MRRMDTGADIIGGGSAASHRQVVPFAEVLVTLTKEQEIKLRWEASFWRSQHRQMLVRLAQSEAAHRVEMAQAAEQAAAREAALRSELEQAQGKIRDLQKRRFGRKSERSSEAEKNPAADHKSSRDTGEIGKTTCRRRSRSSTLTARIARTVVWATSTFPARKTVKFSRSRSRPTAGRSAGGATGGPVSARAPGAF